MKDRYAWENFDLERVSVVNILLRKLWSKEKIRILTSVCARSQTVADRNDILFIISETKVELIYQPLKKLN